MLHAILIEMFPLSPWKEDHEESLNKILIRSGAVKIPKDFQKFLCNGDNKERLFELIEEVWISNRKRMDVDRIVYFTRGRSV